MIESENDKTGLFSSVCSRKLSLITLQSTFKWISFICAKFKKIMKLDYSFKGSLKLLCIFFTGFVYSQESTEIDSTVAPNRWSVEFEAG